MDKVPWKLHKMSSRSKANFDTLHPDLQKIVIGVLFYSDVDLSLTEGHRSTERQLTLFKQGLSKIDGINKKGKHNFNPSEAVDIIAWVSSNPKELMYDPNHLSFLAGVFTTVAKVLYEEGEITHLIRWGGNWDRDGELISDQNFIDMPHFELYKP